MDIRVYTTSALLNIGNLLSNIGKLLSNMAVDTFKSAIF